MRAGIRSIFVGLVCATVAFSCPVPPGIANPAMSEAPCYTDVFPKNSTTGIAIRQYGLPKNEVFIVYQVPRANGGSAIGGITAILDYFSGANSEKRDISFARTTPAVTTHYFAAVGYDVVVVYMMVSTASFPDPSAIPMPTKGLQVTRVRNVTAAVIQFNTSGVPSEADFAAACSNVSSLPSGYAFSSTYPSYVVYNGENATQFTSECWRNVYVAN